MVEEGVYVNDVYSILFSAVVIGALIVNYLLLRMGSNNEVYMTIWGTLNLFLLVGYFAAFFTGSLVFLLILAALLVSLIARRRVVKQLKQIPIPAAEPERVGL